MRKVVKFLIIMIAITNVVLIAYGLYLKNKGAFDEADRFIGFGALSTAFLLMPIFIAYRYSRKDMKDYMFSNHKEKSEESD